MILTDQQKEVKSVLDYILYKIQMPHITFDTVVSWLDRLWIPAIEVLAGVLIGQFVKRTFVKASKKAPDPGVMTFLGSASDIVILAFFCILAVENLGVKLTSIVTIVSALGLGISLALKENMSNVAGGIQILVTKPFSVGDYISISDHKGIVTAIELMFTTITTNHNKVVVVPNSLLVTDILVNYSRMSDRKLTVHIPISLPNDLSSVMKQTASVLKEAKLKIRETDPKVCIEEFEQGYANMMIECTVAPEDYEDIRNQINTLLANRLTVFNPPETPEEVELMNPPVSSSAGPLKPEKENSTEQ